MAHTHQYHIEKDAHKYILTSTPPKPSVKKENHPHVTLNQYVSLSLVHPIQPNNTTNRTPKEMAPLLQEFTDVFQQPIELPPT